MLSLTAALALGSLLGAFGAAPAQAATPPVVQRDGTNGVTADVLPTAQINASGWVADQAIKGDTVFAGGKFTSARPAGAAEGTSESARGNLLAYSLSTGVLNTGFKPVLNGEAKVLALSPDQTRLYVGGSFTTVNGASRARHRGVRHLDGPDRRRLQGDGQRRRVRHLRHQQHGLRRRVLLLGERQQPPGLRRLLREHRLRPERLDAVHRPVHVLGPGGARRARRPGGRRRLVREGRQPEVGLDHGRRERFRLARPQRPGRSGPGRSTRSSSRAGPARPCCRCTPTGRNVYGSGYRYGTTTANYEGVWAAKPTDGTVTWLADCHGDTYDTTVLSGVVYVATHQHDCSNIGGFPEQTPTRIERRGTAFTTTAKGTVQPNSLLPGTFSSFPNQPAPALINWFPDFKNPTCTTVGCSLYESQPTNTIESSGNYVVVGGQFPTVNGVAQQGLVRFAKPAVAPKKDAPRTYNGTGPTVRAVASNVMRVTAAPGDRDNLVLSRIELWRTDKSSPVWSADNRTAPWWRTSVAYTDRDVTAGKTYSLLPQDDRPRRQHHHHRPGVREDAGLRHRVRHDLLAAGPGRRCVELLADGRRRRLDAGDRLRGPGGPHPPARRQPGRVRRRRPGHRGDDERVRPTPRPHQGQANRAPQTFTAEAWFRTTAAGGQVIGFGNRAVGKSEIHDRQVYVTATGELAFYVSLGRLEDDHQPEEVQRRQVAPGDGVPLVGLRHGALRRRGEGRLQRGRHVGAELRRLLADRR